MLAVRVTERAATPALTESPEPVAAADETVLDVEIAGVNPSDRLAVDGSAGGLPFPRTVGYEGVGVAAGRRYYFERAVPPYGSFAERAVAKTASLLELPDAITSQAAVTLGISSLAAWIPLQRLACVAPGESVLVLGASGCVGLAAVQAARILGAARVVAAARSVGRLASLVDLGVVDEVVALSDGGQGEALAGGGFDVVFDPLFGEHFATGLRSLTPSGRLVSVGRSAGGSVEFDLANLAQRTIVGYSNVAMNAAVKAESYRRLVGLALEGRFQLGHDDFGLDDFPAAWSALTSPSGRKILLRPR